MRVPIWLYVPQFLRSSVGAIEITRKPAVNSISIFVLLGMTGLGMTTTTGAV